MNPALFIQLLTLGFQEVPLLLSTVTAIKNLLSRDPAIPLDLQKILAETADDNAATLTRAQAWLAAHPQTPAAPATEPVVPAK